MATDPEGWISDEELAAMHAATDESRGVTATQAFERSTEQVFRQNGPLAAAEIVNIALTCPNDRIRLDAAKYVVDRTLGRIGDAKSLESGSGAPWDSVYSSVVIREPSATEREQGKNVHR